MKKKNIFILILGLLPTGWITSLNAQQFVVTVSEAPIETQFLRVQKITEANPYDSTYLVLSCGIDTNPYNTEVGTTMLTKFKRDGTPIWTRKYGIPPAGSQSIMLGYSITVDANQNIEIGGYTTIDNLTDENFVMHLHSDGTYGTGDWFVHWNYNNYDLGVCDLIFTHDINYPGCVAALSIEYDGNVPSQNYF